MFAAMSLMNAHHPKEVNYMSYLPIYQIKSTAKDIYNHPYKSVLIRQ